MNFTDLLHPRQFIQTVTVSFESSIWQNLTSVVMNLGGPEATLPPIFRFLIAISSTLECLELVDVSDNRMYPRLY